MITPTFLQDVATYVDSKIAKIVLNDVYEVTQFSTRTVAGGKVSLQYLVPFGSVVEVVKIELRDVAGNVLSSNAVYVPVTTDTLISQTIEVKEV